MSNIRDIVDFCDRELDSSNHKDYCPNGLQVAGSSEVRRIISGVTANLALLQAAAERGADLLLVHHGYFWRGENPCLVGAKRERLRLLLEHNINLLAYHLPLDSHATLGNNARLAQLCGWQITGRLQQQRHGLGLVGCLPEALSPQQLAASVSAQLGREALLIPAQRPIKTLAWCSGAAQDFIDLAIDAGVDAYLSGEISERTTHSARENNISYLAIGHHASERGGVQALGELLARQFALEHEFIDIDNPV